MRIYRFRDILTSLVRAVYKSIKGAMSQVGLPICLDKRTIFRFCLDKTDKFLILENWLIF